MGQGEEGRGIDRPGVVGREIAAEGETAKEPRAGQGAVGIFEMRAGEEVPRLAGDLPKAAWSPGHEFDSGADPRE